MWSSVCSAGASASVSVKSVGQERNTYALNLLRRIKGKLEGRVDCSRYIPPGSSSAQAGDGNGDRAGRKAAAAKLSVPEQVDFLIQLATSEESLCVMYEGWTPWI